MEILSTMNRLLNTASVPAYRLKEGKTYSVKGAVVLCPLHPDDFSTANSEDLKPLETIENPEFTVLESRMKALNGHMWYRVELADKRTGWINSTVLLGKEIT